MALLEIQPNMENAELAKLLGSHKGRISSHSLNKKVKLWKKKSRQIIKPKLIYQKHKLKKVSNGVILLDGNQRLRSTKLSKTLRHSQELVCFLATIGSGIEKEINRLMQQRRLAEAYLLDAMGSTMVENLVEQFQSHMRQHYRTKDKMVTLRFSPGYCDWPVTEQKKLFRLIDFQRVGVELTDSCLMKPRKSISGVFGLLPCPDGKDRRTYNPCLECNKINCPARRV
ncbi:MAG: vitamin B12 dependent-methionine synthase activation domain-containing protein [Desulfobacteraceae bacterium]